MRGCREEVCTYASPSPSPCPYLTPLQLLLLLLLLLHAQVQLLMAVLQSKEGSFLEGEELWLVLGVRLGSC